jgi:hypothetical protein
LRVIEYRCHDREIGQMRPAVVRRIAPECVAALHVPAVRLGDSRDASAHRAQVHRHVGCVRNQLSLRVEDRAGKVEALLDVYRAGRLLEHDAHLLGDMHEECVHHFETGLIEYSGRRGASLRRVLPQHEIAVVGERARPSRRDEAR